MLSNAEQEKRLEAWELGLNDVQAAKCCGCSVATFLQWRRRNKLPSNAKNTKHLGVSYKQALPPEKWPVIESFLRDVNHHKPQDLNEYLRVWPDYHRARSAEAWWQ